MSTADDGSVPRASGGSAGRIVAVDVLRGMTMMAMILVNNPGSWSTIYAPLGHAEWHGWTPTDLVFPFFLFLVGVAIPFALHKRIARGDDRSALLRKITTRSLALFGIGLFMSAFPLFTWEPEFGLRSFERLRIPGVLQRIAVCYAVAASLFLFCRPRALGVVASICLFGYWAAMIWIPVPDPETGALVAGAIDSPGTHLSAYLDRLVIGESHLWRSARVYDPEGLFSTLPAIATTLGGVFVGRILQRDAPARDRVLLLFVVGGAWTVIGYAWGWAFPINKKIWTSSYAVFAAGLATTALAMIAYFTDVRGTKRDWSRPFVTFGINALTVFVMSGLLAKSMALIQVSEGVSLKRWIYANGYESWLGRGEFSSLMFAATWVLGWYVVLRWMRRRGIVVRV